MRATYYKKFLITFQPDDDGLEMSDSSDDSDYEQEMEACRNEELVHKSLLTNAPNQRLGGWEEHTRGMGSKLMAQMGYIVGTGLGKRADGRIEPVEATVLPAGKSLGKSLFMLVKYCSCF